MADTHFKIVFEGQVRPGVELEVAKANLARLFSSETAAVEKLFSGHPVALKRGLPHEEAERYMNALNEAGVEARIEPDPAISLSIDKKEVQPPASPYAPPKSQVGTEFAESSTLKVFGIQGRIGRLRYLAWILVLSVTLLPLSLITVSFMTQSLVAGGLLFAVLLMAYALLAAQMGIRRLHDIGWSGWLLLLNLVPFVGSFFPILMTAIPGTKGPNKYGAPQPPNTRAVKILAGLWVLLIPLIIVGSLSGGMDTLKNELDVQTDEYEQSLPYDDEAERDGVQTNADDVEKSPEQDTDKQ
ncbi:DUF805 domain-containing protein [Pseudomonas triticifolii]|uniref:DUF805 domain-containing protein n=1 Tax=Pseudomonas triticifolii TaxID=2762592 RepID=A0ABR7BL19_9PSED|nr:DUF805 domain-containing protein [Pseudomonas triticifolii]MBC3957855.1 DUF805 domain-containing protein [Pseudomonas triticifolii]